MMYFKSGLLRLMYVCYNLLSEAILETTLDWTPALTPLSISWIEFNPDGPQKIRVGFLLEMWIIVFML